MHDDDTAIRREHLHIGIGAAPGALRDPIEQEVSRMHRGEQNRIPEQQRIVAKLDQRGSGMNVEAAPGASLDARADFGWVCLGSDERRGSKRGRTGPA